jgi:DNA-binding beta-propeller fold protein YncE/mono/diheme cytochrome c family protein
MNAAAAPPKRLRTQGIVYAGNDCSRRHPGQGPSRATLERRGSTVVLAEHEGDAVAYVADEDSRALHLVGLDRREIAGKTALPGIPAQALVLADGRVAVALRDRSSVVVLEPSDDLASPLATLCEMPVPAEAWGIAATPDDARVVITSGWGAALSVLDGASFERRRTVPLPREPRAVIVDDEGKRAFVSHAIGSRLSVVDLENDRTTARALELGVSAPARPRERGSRTGSQGFVLASVVIDEGDKKLDGERPVIKGTAPRPSIKTLPGKPPPKAPAPVRPPSDLRPGALRDRIFAPMAAVDPGNPLERSFEYYGHGRRSDGLLVAEPIVGVVDVARERPLTRDILSRAGGHAPKGCVLPRAAAVSAADNTLLVACLGINAVLELDARGTDPMRMELRRWSVPAGPTGVAVDPARRRAVVWSQFRGQLTILNLTSSWSPRTSISVDYTPSGTVAAFSEGRDLFHRSTDPSISASGLACASCHPDGRDDGLTWATSSGPRQTLMLAGRMSQTAPYGWRGQEPDLHSYLRGTISRLGGSGISKEEIGVLAAYISATPPPPPLLHPQESADPARAQVIARGRSLFFDPVQGCDRCHVDAVGTDKQLHNVGSRAQADEAVDFDTPALRFLRGTAPYFHDGRYATLDEMLASSNPWMGNTANLSADDRAALVAFLETL